MSGDVASAKPPLPHRPRGASRNLKQREREVPEVDWGHALQHFAACISDELDELHTRFVQENVVTFAAWKRLWGEAKMSAAFHVEFWESTPTNTHKTILQQALDGLVWCIEERGGEFGHAADVAALIGRVFAMYCAYAVQLGTPKHKIDVNPQEWTALLSINCVMCGVGATLFPSAAREVRAMMHRLVVQENAFLRCLQGFGPSVRLQERASSTQGGGGARQDSLQDSRSTSEENVPVKLRNVARLKALDDRYQELMSRTRAAGSTVPGSSARLGDRRTQTAVTNPLSHGTENDGQALARALTSYLEYKAKEDARGVDRVARAAAARELESRMMAEMNKSERDDRSNIMDLSDRGSIVSVPPSPTARLAACRRRPQSDSGGSEAFLAELESELHADIMSDQVEPSAFQASHRVPAEHRDKQSSAISEISEVDSDALADLERELEQTARIIPSQAPPKGRTNVSPPVQRKRGRKPAKEASHTLTASVQRPAATSRIVKPRLAVQRTRSESVASCVSLAESWAASSTADSDGLADIQAELDAIPSLAGPARSATRPVSRAVDDHQSSSKANKSSSIVPTAKPRAKPSARQTTSRKRKASACVVEGDQPNQPVQTRAEGQHKESRSRALSVASDSSELMALLQAELDCSAVPLAKATPSATTNRKATPAAQPTLRRSSRLSSVGSEADSNALEELEKELQATPATFQSAPQVQPTKTSRVVLSKRPTQRSSAARSSAKKARINKADSPAVTAVHQPRAGRKSSNTSGKQQESKRRPMAQRESTRISSVSSDTESDGLAELVAELETSVAKTSQEKRNPLPKKAITRRTAAKKLPASSKVTTQRLVSNDSPRVPAPTAIRRSARLSSMASDTESDGLEDLMAELDSAPASTPASKPPAANIKKPRSGAGAARKQPVRSEPMKTKAKVKPKQVTKSMKATFSAASRVTRTPRATRQTQLTVQASGLIAIQPPTRQTSRTPVNGLSSRRSTRSSSVAFDSDSDGLAELEAELQAGPN